MSSYIANNLHSTMTSSLLSYRSAQCAAHLISCCMHVAYTKILGHRKRSGAPQLLEDHSDLAAGALLSALLGAHLDGQDHVLGALGAPEQDGPGAACVAASYLRLPKWRTCKGVCCTHAEWGHKTSCHPERSCAWGALAKSSDGCCHKNPPTKDSVRSDSRRVSGAAARLKNSACREGYRFSSSCPYSSQEPVVSSKSCRGDQELQLTGAPQSFRDAALHQTPSSIMVRS